MYMQTFSPTVVQGVGAGWLQMDNEQLHLKWHVLIIKTLEKL